MFENYSNYVPLEKMTKQDNKPEWLVIHCSDSDLDNFESIQRYHVTAPTHLWENIGYHYLIERGGKLVKGRPDLYHGGHVAEDGMNKKSIGICMCGKFENKMPDPGQTETLRKLLKELSPKYNIPVQKIKNHRNWNKGKTCPGSKISDTWAQELISAPNEKEMIKKQIIDLLAKL